ncbi:Cu(I)-responsive transcriptional regulator [Vibrio rumoiensis]|uniref:HTH-type transcriptional regulator CueR n=1 Tax=Vibrio rumoiensis 1S-45 TaxID=1188252 RepID=A0A1E5E0Q0_9VIBR|nr:Cu(I)-responsive transcriptional regulator [Vibrio rumoiensis]OEF23999.1 Cu(I)-responsive transcriptional regulator [Vibrio rumoiensis 1S-45]
MNISQVAKLTKLSAKSIRFYESKGVISPPSRSDNGYRTYDNKQINQLEIVARARAVGFNLEQCKSLVELANDPGRSSYEVKETAKKKLTEVNAKLEELQVIRQQLVEWIDECPGDEGPNCPIINDLTGH